MNNSESKQLCITTLSKVLYATVPLAHKYYAGKLWRFLSQWSTRCTFLRRTAPLVSQFLWAGKATNTKKRPNNQTCFSIWICNKNEKCRVHCLSKVSGITQMVKDKLVLMCVFHLHPEWKMICRVNCSWCSLELQTAMSQHLCEWLHSGECGQAENAKHFIKFFQVTACFLRQNLMR